MRDKDKSYYKSTSDGEFLIFLALTLLMGHVSKNELSDYWSHDRLLFTEIFGANMPRSRYKALLRALRFTNEVANPDDRMAKLRPVLTQIRDQNMTVFKPYENITVDESLVLHKGRLSFKQYMPLKRARFGIKLFMIVDCSTGFFLNFLTYVGKKTPLAYQGYQSKIGASGRVVLTLMRPYVNKGHKLFIDNWYTSLPLAEILLSFDTNVCGTIKSNRAGLPSPLPQLRKNEIEWYHAGKLLFIRWFDKREVRFLSTMHKPRQMEVLKRRRAEVMAPKPAADYNKYMGAVDQTDMELSFNSSVRKSVRWYVKLFFHIVDLQVRNALIISKIKRGSENTLKNFRLELIREILEKYREFGEEKIGRPPKTSIGSTTKRLTERHFISSIPVSQTQLAHATPSKSPKAPQRNCALCKKNGIRSLTRYECIDCGVALHLEPCFKLYHTVR